MKKRQNISIFPLLIMGVFLVYASSCKKNEDNGPTSDNSTAVFNPNVSYGTMTDQDGNVYKTVIIGTQTWMAQNLRTTKYNDGTSIPNVTNDDGWEALTTGAYCNYNNTSGTDQLATYGRLYNWYAVKTEKLAPAGWHVPTDAEWTTLTDYLGGTSVAGGKLKETGTAHWINPNTEATNETGFTALPGGDRVFHGGYLGIGYYGNWWSATEYDASSAWVRYLFYDFSYIDRNYGNGVFGFSVRCVKD